MKKILIILIVFVTLALLHSYTIEETISQIETLKTEIKQNEILVEQKIADLRKTNPLFAGQDPFESDMKYIGRMSKAMPQIDRLRKQYLGDLWQKMSILRGSLFETNNIIVTLDPKKYDSNTEEWKVTVNHLYYQKEHFEVILKIAKTDASALFKNKEKLQKTGILVVDVGDKIGLAKLKLNDPISGFEFEYEFQPMKSFKHNYDVNSVAFSPDGKFLATGSNDNKAHIFNLETGNEVRSFKHGHKVNSVVFSPDGKFLASTSGNFDEVYIFNLETGNEVISFKYGDKVNSVAFSPYGKFLASGNFDGTRIVNLETGNEVKSFTYGYYGISSVAFSPDGKFLATGSYAGSDAGDDVNTALIFNLETGNEVRSFKIGGKVKSVAFSPDGKFLATGSNDNKARIFNLETGNEVRAFKYGEKVNSVAFSPDGKYFTVGCKDTYAYLYRILF